MNRIGRLAVLTATATGIGVVALAGAAQANVYAGKILTNGQSTCVSQYASYQVRVDGTATNKGAKFRVYRNGAQIAASATDTTAAYAAEFRTSFGNFPGPGNYTFCALNRQTTNTFATVQIRTDGEF